MRFGIIIRNWKNMFLISYKKQSIVLAVWIVVVVTLFNAFSDRMIASLFATAGFVLWPTFFLISELANERRKIHTFSLLVFLLLAAIPLLYLRVSNWGADFSNLELFGLKAESIHKNANYLYFFIQMSAAYHHWKFKK